MHEPPSRCLLWYHTCVFTHVTRVYSHMSHQQSGITHVYSHMSHICIHICHINKVSAQMALSPKYLHTSQPSLTWRAAARALSARRRRAPNQKRTTTTRSNFGPPKSGLHAECRSRCRSHGPTLRQPAQVKVVSSQKYRLAIMAQKDLLPSIRRATNSAFPLTYQRYSLVCLVMYQDSFAL